MYLLWDVGIAGFEPSIEAMRPAAQTPRRSFTLTLALRRVTLLST
jgi:hypothetical protein